MNIFLVSKFLVRERETVKVVFGLKNINKSLDQETDIQNFHLFMQKAYKSHD